MPLNKVWFLTYFCCLYLFLYTSFRLYTYLFIISIVHSSQLLVNSLQFIVHRIIINFHINTFTHQHIYTFTHLHINSLTHSLINPFTHSHIYPFTHQHIHTFTHLHINPLTHSPIYTSTHLHTHRYKNSEYFATGRYSTGVLPLRGRWTTSCGNCFYNISYSIVRWSTTIVTIATIATFIFTGWHRGTTSTEVSPLRGEECMCHPWL